MHIITFFFNINTDTDTTLWYRYQIDLYGRYKHNFIALREAVLSWKAETCDQEHLPPPTTTAYAVMMHSGYNNGDLHGACLGRVPLRNVLILLEYTGLLWLVEPFLLPLSYRVPVYIPSFTPPFCFIEDILILWMERLWWHNHEIVFGNPASNNICTTPNLCHSVCLKNKFPMHAVLSNINGEICTSMINLWFSRSV